MEVENALFLTYSIDVLWDRHACPGRFLAIQEIKTITALLVTRYSRLELEDPSKKNIALFAVIGQPVPTGLYFTSRTLPDGTSTA